MSEFITRINNINNEYEVIFKTDNKEEYKYIEDCCREVIDHLKPITRKKFIEEGLMKNAYRKRANSMG